MYTRLIFKEIVSNLVTLCRYTVVENASLVSEETSYIKTLNVECPLSLS